MVGSVGVNCSDHRPTVESMTLDPLHATADDTTGLERLAETLWAERNVVEFLLFKLITAKLLLAADERRFISPALAEVERVVDALRDAELHRAMALEAYARTRGVPAEEITLGWLATHTPAPWQEVFADHRKVFASLANEIDATTADNRQLARAGLNTIQQTIGMLTGPQATTDTYDARGQARPVNLGPVRIDRAL